MIGRGRQTKTQGRSETKRCGSACSNAGHSHGYTILEMMLFLAITAGLFVMFANTFSGRQARTEFQVGTRDIESRIRDTINDTNTGYAASPADFSCELVGGGSNTRLDFSNTQTELGSNGDCVFLGRVIQFGVDESDGNRKYYTHSVAGARVSQDSTDPAATTTGNYRGSRAVVIPNTTFQETLPPGLEFAWMRSDIGGTYRLNSSLAILSKIVAATEARSLNTFMLPIPVLGNERIQTPGAVQAEVELIGCGSRNANCHTATNLQSVATNLRNVTVCFNSQGSRQHSVVTIQGTTGNLTTDSVINEGPCPSV